MKTKILLLIMLIAVIFTASASPPPPSSQLDSLSPKSQVLYDLVDFLKDEVKQDEAFTESFMDFWEQRRLDQISENMFLDSVSEIIYMGENNLTPKITTFLSSRNYIISDFSSNDFQHFIDEIINNSSFNNGSVAARLRCTERYNNFIQGSLLAATVFYTLSPYLGPSAPLGVAGTTIFLGAMLLAADVVFCECITEIYGPGNCPP